MPTNRPVLRPFLPGLLPVFALCGCVFSGGDGGVDDTGPGELIEWGSYELAGNLLTTSAISPHYICDSTSEVPLIVNGEFERVDTVVILGNSMMFWWDIDPILDANDDSVGTIQYGTRYVRVGSGSGIRGTWRYADHSSYRVLSGTLPADLARSLTADSLAWARFFTYRQDLVEYTADSVFTRTKLLAADLFLAFWNGRMLPPDQPQTMADSAYRNISVTKVDQHTVRLHGKTTGEVVTYWQGNQGEYRYTSSDPARDTIEFIPARHACRTEWPDEWYGDFLLENSRFPGDTLEVRGDETAALLSEKRGQTRTTAFESFLRKASRFRAPR